MLVGIDFDLVPGRTTVKTETIIDLTHTKRKLE